MKLIILDHFRRWWLVMTAIFVAYFIFKAVSIPDINSQKSNDNAVASLNHTIKSTHNIFIFQGIIWLGFLLIWDFQRGLPRVLTIMPVTLKQIGRAWWLSSVAFPAIAAGIIGLLAILLFSGGINISILLENYLAGWVLITLFLGAMFGAQTFMPTTIPDSFMDRIRNFLFGSLFALTIIGVIFLQLETPTTNQTILVFIAYAILFVLGWFRAERMVLQRAGFRLFAKSSNQKMAQHKTPQGFGGLPYLAQRTFIQTTLIGLALVFFMALVMSFVGHGQNPAQTVASMTAGGSTPYIFFILIFSIIPVAFQLRFLRTLPVLPSKLAAALVFLPLISIAAIGLIVATFASFVGGETLFLSTLNIFLLLGAKAAIVVSIVVWRGLELGTYLLIFLLVLSDSLVSLGMTIIFHLGSHSPARPWWVNITIFLLCLIVSLVLTRRLLTKSSSAYRVRTMPVNSWSMTRR